MVQWLASEIFWSRIAVAALAVAAALAWSQPRVSFARRLDAVLGIAVAAAAISIAMRWIGSGQGPFLTLYEVLLSNLFSLGLFCLLAVRAAPVVREALPVAVSLLAMLGIWMLFLPTEVVALPPTFDNPWLWAHVIAGKLFLGACLVATALALRLLIAHVRARPKQIVERFAKPDSAVWRFAALAFVCDSFMLVAGAAWANDAWGRYWAWDPLETWALLTWLALAAVLHARLGWRLPIWAGWAGLCIVFVLAFLTFFGVPFVSIAAHKGVM